MCQLVGRGAERAGTGAVRCWFASWQEPGWLRWGKTHLIAGSRLFGVSDRAVRSEASRWAVRQDGIEAVVRCLRRMPRCVIMKPIAEGTARVVELTGRACLPGLIAAANPQG